MISRDVYFRKPIEKKQIEMKDFSTKGEEEKKTQDIAKEKFKTLMLLPYLAEEELEPGDIILSYYPKSYGAADVVIRAGQSIIEKPFTDEAPNYVHAAIYLGDGKVAEAVSDGLKVNPLTHERFKMQADHINEFRVFRPIKDDLAKETARLGKGVAQDETPQFEGIAAYNYLTAVLSVFGKSDLDENSIKRYLKAAYFAHTGDVPYDKKGVRNFHCSYLVAWILQGAESKNVLNDVNILLPEKEKIVFPDLSKEKTHQAKGKKLDAWAAGVAKKHKRAMINLIKMNVDAKSASAQRLYKLIQDNPDIFKPVLRFVAPPSPGSETEMT